MHIPDGILSIPVAAATTALGGAGFAYGLWKLRGQAADRTVVLMGMMAAFVFAAQMVNFPVFPGISGHLMGGLLSAVVLGPWAGATVIGAVLMVQALLFADGGFTALGANFLNMGLVGAVLGYAIYTELRRLLGGGTRATLVAAMVAAWLSVVVSAGLCALELTLSTSAGQLVPILSWMLLIHAAIGVGEALITGLVLRSVLAVSPQSLADQEAGAPVPRWSGSRLAAAGLGTSLAVALFLAPFAYDAPDGLESASQRAGVVLEVPEGEAAPETAAIQAPMPDYQLPLPGIGSLRIATAAAGVVGTLTVCLAATVLGRALVRRESGRGLPPGVGTDVC